MRFGERGRGMWTAAIAEADKQTTQHCEAIFPQGHPFRQALRRGVCPGSGTGTWRSLMQKLPLIHGHNTRERTESSLQFKPRTCCSAEVFPARMGERGTPLGKGAAARICGTGPRLFSLFTAACPDGGHVLARPSAFPEQILGSPPTAVSPTRAGFPLTPQAFARGEPRRSFSTRGTAFSSAQLSTAPPAQSSHHRPLSDAHSTGQSDGMRCSRWSGRCAPR